MLETAVQIEHVLVTGGTGRLGQFVVSVLRPHYRVSALDRPQAHIPPDLPVDVLDLPALTRALRGMDAVVHLAAIDASVQAAPATVFETNVRGTWNVMEAAQLNGVQQVILCSSVSALGIDHTNPSVPPLYLPIDEEHPLRPTQPYGLSKQLGEMIARSFARRGPMAVTCLRPTWIMFPDTLARLARRLGPGDTSAGRIEPLPLLRSYVAPRDAAAAVRLALARPASPFAVYFIAAHDTFEPRPTLDHLREVYGTLPEIRKPDLYRQHPRASAYDTQRAREELGWTPTGSWHDLVAEVPPADPGPPACQRTMAPGPSPGGR
jgi:nucleoside-diphosphate-sugar epimerase